MPLPRSRRAEVEPRASEFGRVPSIWARLSSLWNFFTPFSSRAHLRNALIAPLPSSASFVLPIVPLHVPITLLKQKWPRSVSQMYFEPISNPILCDLRPRTGPVRARGFCPGSRRPRARVPLVVWGWDLFVTRPLCCGLSAPARHQFFALRSVTVCH